MLSYLHLQTLCGFSANVIKYFKVIELYLIGFESHSLSFAKGFLKLCWFEKLVSLNPGMIVYYTLSRYLDKGEYRLGQCS